MEVLKNIDKNNSEFYSKLLISLHKKYKNSEIDLIDKIKKIKYNLFLYCKKLNIIKEKEKENEKKLENISNFFVEESSSLIDMSKVNKIVKKNNIKKDIYETFYLLKKIIKHLTKKIMND